ncbi:AraC family ligand binding domain-containing protein [Lysinibacillus sp. Bpr_S20]|uniref:cupin domain-containing protein n=1 Tax=Lysinibacillus sp. Bpr_S20 TaxID=2933964 RepID=UPI0020136FB2|nr:AraC family ligand binding domain-containing protein [Lysinibacillus sp. Bpr_S20]MCL1701552.1 AraC family ligand binding domain-containing protein [Lysinibacillus sp. Bpr_S20]
MKLYKFSKENGKKITQFKSNFIMSRIINTEVPANIGCMHLEENGIIGYHQAVVPQLLLILEGEGFVRNEQEQYFQVQPGDAVFWEKDEWHETKTDKGLTGIVIESEQLNPAAFMPLK